MNLLKKHRAQKNGSQKAKVGYATYVVADLMTKDYTQLAVPFSLQVPNGIILLYYIKDQNGERPSKLPR